MDSTQWITTCSLLFILYTAQVARTDDVARRVAQPCPCDAPGGNCSQSDNPCSEGYFDDLNATRSYTTEVPTSPHVTDVTLSHSSTQGYDPVCHLCNDTIPLCCRCHATNTTSSRVLCTACLSGHNPSKDAQSCFPVSKPETAPWVIPICVVLPLIVALVTVVVCLLRKYYVIENCNKEYTPNLPSFEELEHTADKTMKSKMEDSGKGGKDKEGKMPDRRYTAQPGNGKKNNRPNYVESVHYGEMEAVGSNEPAKSDTPSKKQPQNPNCNKPATKTKPKPKPAQSNTPASDHPDTSQPEELYENTRPASNSVNTTQPSAITVSCDAGEEIYENQNFHRENEETQEIYENQSCVSAANFGKVPVKTPESKPKGKPQKVTSGLPNKSSPQKGGRPVSILPPGVTNSASKLPASPDIIDDEDIYANNDQAQEMSMQQISGKNQRAQQVTTQQVGDTDDQEIYANDDRHQSYEEDEGIYANQ